MIRVPLPLFVAAWFGAALSFQAGCGKSGANAGAGASSTASGGAGADANAAAAPRAPARALEWRGTYTSAAGTVYVPPDWKNVRWKGADTSSGLGQGSMSLAIDGASGRVTGTLEGPLGPATIVGLALGNRLTATVTRKDPTDQGFVGTLVGNLGSAQAEGTMNVALWDASALRTATFTLSSQTHG